MGRGRGAVQRKLRVPRPIPGIPPARKPGCRRIGDRALGLHFEGVGFSSGIDLLLEAGSVTAIIGAAGSGKSTLGSLDPRLHDTATGQLAIDRIDVRDLSATELIDARCQQ